ncbi:MAG: hypothetical protein JWO57_3292, partial [Pseudonocardiales bacterium]|nr:hypothetical protein [Pseudonocardiales bacterium]
MVGRRRDADGFRPGPSAKPSLAPSRRQTAAMIAVLVLAASGIAVASDLVKPNKARSFQLFYGSVFLNDERAPVAVDLTDGKPTVRLVGANTQVSAKSPADLAVTPLTNGTLLLNSVSGEFNMVDATGFVVKTAGGGVPLPRASGQTRSVGIPSGESAYIVQAGPSGTSVFLVGQSTVQTATGLGAKVTPRASTTMAEASTTAAGAAMSANGALWLLVGRGGARTIRQLSVPAGSDAGATLATTDHGAVPGIATVGAAVRNSDGTGGDLVGVASADSVRVFDTDGTSRTAAVTGLSGVDQILAASNATGRLRFLYHSSTGWSVVSVGADAGPVAGRAQIIGIPPQTRLATPAASDSQLYTMDSGTTGQIWQISQSGAVQPIHGAGGYPVVMSASGHAVEAADFSDAYVVARGSRVVFDSPNHVQAVALFTDGSRPPVVIDKSAAVSLNAAGGASALTDAHLPKGRKLPPKKGQKPAPQPVQPINNELRCKTIQQIPHIPTITQATPGSRSVQLRWSYPLLDTQDCAPSTYAVSVTLLGSSAPSPPSSVTVQGQDGVNLTGLFPGTRYEIAVTAFINGAGTPSIPVQVATGPEGPAAATNVRVSTDSSGNWTITWNSCGGIRQGCVPSSSWNVVPQLCDGLPGLSTAPATISVAGDPTQHTFRTTYPGSTDLLGHGLAFQIVGIGDQGAVGTPGSAGGCSYSWSNPIAADISVVPSIPAGKTQHGTTTTATVSLRLGADPVRSTGGVGAQFTYQLLSAGQVIATTGPTADTTASFPGIAPGQTYQVQVAVAPPRHPEAQISVGPVPVQVAVSDWPQLGLSATFSTADAVQGTLTVDISGVSSATSNGERFDLVNGSLTCGNTSAPLSRSAIDPSQPLTFEGINRTQYNGACSVQGQLQENGTGTLLFGGATSPQLTGTVAIPVPVTNVNAGNFHAAWSDASPRANPQIVVSYDNADPLLPTFATDWSIVVSNAGGPCGSST